MSITTSDLASALATTARQVVEAAGPSIVAIGRHGRGSGIVLADGKVATNAHNLRDRTTTVTFADGRQAQGELVAADGEGDLVVLAVDTTGAPPLAWSDAETSQGDLAFSVTVGRHGARVTYGMVSSTGRSFRGPRGRRVGGALEHTVPLARGASGGPLLDAEGRLVGINTHRIGDGFYLAIPADAELRARLDSLASGVAPRHLRLGIAVAPPPVARRLRRSVGLPEREGLLVRGVEPGGPAAGAGIEAGDLLVRAGEIELTRPHDLHRALDALAPDATSIQMVVVRGVEERTVTVSFASPAE
jgi:S1-C subfamily serine protease